MKKFKKYFVTLITPVLTPVQEHYRTARRGVRPNTRAFREAEAGIRYTSPCKKWFVEYKDGNLVLTNPTTHRSYNGWCEVTMAKSGHVIVRGTDGVHGFGAEFDVEVSIPADLLRLAESGLFACPNEKGLMDAAPAVKANMDALWKGACAFNEAAEGETTNWEGKGFPYLPNYEQFEDEQGGTDFLFLAPVHAIRLLREVERCWRNGSWAAVDEIVLFKNCYGQPQAYDICLGQFYTDEVYVIAAAEHANPAEGKAGTALLKAEILRLAAEGMPRWVLAEFLNRDLREDPEVAALIAEPSVEETLSSVSRSTSEAAEAWLLSDGTVTIFRCGEDEELASYISREAASREWNIF